MNEKGVPQIQGGKLIFLISGRGSQGKELDLTEELASELQPLLDDRLNWDKRHRRLAFPGYIVMLSSGGLLLIFYPQDSALKLLFIALLILSVAYEIAMLVRYINSPLRRKLRDLEKSASKV